MEINLLRFSLLDALLDFCHLENGHMGSAFKGTRLYNKVGFGLHATWGSTTTSVGRITRKQLALKRENE